MLKRKRDETKAHAKKGTTCAKIAGTHFKENHCAGCLTGKACLFAFYVPWLQNWKIELREPLLKMHEHLASQNKDGKTLKENNKSLASAGVLEQMKSIHTFMEKFATDREEGNALAIVLQLSFD